MLDRNVQWLLLNEAVITLEEAVNQADQGQSVQSAYTCLRLLGIMIAMEILIKNGLFDKQAILAYNVIGAKLEELSLREIGETKDASKSE